MTSELTSGQLDQELQNIREQNRKLVHDLEYVQKENTFLRRLILEDRQWLAEALTILHDAQKQGENAPLSCNCGLEAVLQRAQERVLDTEQVFDLNKNE